MQGSPSRCGWLQSPGVSQVENGGASSSSSSSGVSLVAPSTAAVHCRCCAVPGMADWGPMAFKPFKDCSLVLGTIGDELLGIWVPCPQDETGVLNPFRTAVSFWGQLGTNDLEFDWCVPKTGLEF